ncbi:retrotransposon protein, putative, ty1-copia subclass [Tanacetum coccineum]|uniref:Retrotransposon protein, putative, ty1-copia subclass n=1 Tax=Tanacetum coccineum TaxID=301880 RepID=A0ABQ4WLD6_9ASTR
MARKPFPHQVERAKDLLGLIHTDVCGPFRTVSREGASYFITFTDDFSRYGYVYLMKHKHEVFETFKVFQNEVENQLGKKIKAIRSDRGEYLSHEFVNHMKSYGIVSQLTPPYTPQHNGVSERRNQTLLDMVRSMMNLITLPKSFWGYALESAARILNMVPTKKVERTPYEIWHGKAPKLSYLRVWGCYPKETMGYYFYYPSENKIFVTRNAEFFKDNLIVQEARGKHNEVVHMEVEPQNVKVPIRRSARIPQAPDIYGFYVDVDEYELGNLNEPPNYKATLSVLEYDKWIERLTECSERGQSAILKERFRVMENTKKGYPPMMVKLDYRSPKTIRHDTKFSRRGVRELIRYLMWSRNWEECQAKHYCYVFYRSRVPIAAEASMNCLDEENYYGLAISGHQIKDL